MCYIVFVSFKFCAALPRGMGNAKLFDLKYLLLYILS